MIRRWFILGILIAVMVLLLWNFYMEVVIYHAMDAVSKTQQTQAKTPGIIPPYQPAWDKSILENNLFSKSRGYTPSASGPKESLSTVIPEVPLVPPELSLSGIIFDQYGEFVAFIQTAGGAPKRVRKGDMFEGILVVNISPREVKLLWNNKEITLSMKQIKSVPRKK